MFRRIKLLLGSKLARNQARPELYFGTSSTTCKAEHENKRHHAIPYQKGFLACLTLRYELCENSEYGGSSYHFEITRN